MSTYGWSTLIGASVEGQYALDELVRAESRMAVFRAVAIDGHYAGEVLLTAVRGSQTECDQYVRRFLEAKFLKHANLMDVLNAGEADVQGIHFAFFVTEPAGSTLQQEETLDRDSAWLLARDVVAGLGYLHSESLVYCALRPETIWRVGRSWKLGDYHELRLAGTGRAAETRAMMGRLPEVPPEAFEGVVSPAWDIWALGVTLARMLRRDSRERRAGPLPAQFEDIVNRCLNPDPRARPTSAELAERLSGGYQSTSSTTAVDSAEPEFEVRDHPIISAPRGRPSVFGVLAGVARTGHEKIQRLFSPHEKSQSTEVRRSSSKWIVFPVAGALVGATLTLFALKHDEPRSRKAFASNSTSTASHVPAAGAPASLSEPSLPEGKPNPESPTPAMDRMKDGAAQNTVDALLEKWIQSTRNRNVDQQMTCYAPVVETYYGRHQLSTAQLRTEKLRQFSSIGAIRKFQISNVRIAKKSSSRTVVSFRKEWDFGTFAGSEQDELEMRLVNGEWKIASERGKKLNWVRRGRLNAPQASANIVEVAYSD